MRDIELIQEYEKVEALVNQSEKILITGHHAPDGDAMGSSLAIYHWLKSKGKKTELILPNPFARNMEWMPGAGDIVLFEGNEDVANAKINQADLVFVMDYNRLSRLKKMGENFPIDRKRFILIDHHREPDTFDVNISDVNACSTCELVYRMLKHLAQKITPDMAHCMYTGMLTDTGNFRHAVRPEVFKIAGELLELGADHQTIQNHVNNSGSLNSLKLNNYALYKKLEVLEECATAYVTLSDEELRMFHYSPGDTEGLVNVPLSVEGIKLSVFMREVHNGDKIEVKMSFRSIGNFSVNDFAKNYFNGGGHKNAAGGISYVDLKSTVDQLIQFVKDHKNEILAS